MKTINVFFVALVITFASYPASSQNNPSFEDVLSLTSFSSPRISPNGKHVIFQRQSTDWEENRYDREIWISKNRGEPFQLTNTPKGNSYGYLWSPDSKWIGFLSNRDDKSQIYIIRTDGGEAFQLTNSENGVNSFDWSPDGKMIAFTQSEKQKKKEKLEKKYGSYSVEDKEFNLNKLWILDFKPEKVNLRTTPQQMSDSAFKAHFEPRMVMDSADFTITNFLWSPDSKKIAFSHQPDPLINTFFKSDISIYDLEKDSFSKLISNPSFDGLQAWSPDGKTLIYSSSESDSTSNYYKNAKIFSINIDGTENRRLAENLDEDINTVRWEKSGIYTIVWQKTKRKPFKIDFKTGVASVINCELDMVWNLNFSNDGKEVVLSGANDNSITEVYTTDNTFKKLNRLTGSTNQIRGWAVSDSEVISWKSKDGVTIEGVLHKPQDYEPGKKYPLLVVIHGGPTGISRPGPVPSYVYPFVQWLNKGAIILQPNYRGSAGYGEEFRSLNVRNLGVGDAWDVMSGVDHLIEQGIVDENKMGAMGWSQGGYISAFLTTNTNRFKAISVGAGISNWMTYYVNTDIHPFTRQYLKATPWSDQEIYEMTSPMTNINNASTPTLIQHGEFDRRVPIANAFELYQGLQDVGVETKLVVYKGFGHGITKPKERLAATWHNWQWFLKYIWGEEVELPLEDE